MSDTNDPETTHDDAQTGEATEPTRDEGEVVELSAEARLEAERDKLKDQLLRTAADFENFRRRARKDAEDAERRGREDAVRTMLDLVDNLERAEQAAQTATDIAAVAEGVRLVLRGFDDIAQRLGLERVPALGVRFDPNVHDAVQQIESADHEPGSIVAEVVPGYRLHGKLLRAALVVVAKAPSA